YIFPQLKNRIGIRGAFQKSNHTVIGGGISVNIIPFFVFHIRVLLIVQALCVWERDWQAQLFLRPVPVFPCPTHASESRAYPADFSALWQPQPQFPHGLLQWLYSGTHDTEPYYQRQDLP